MSRGVKRFIRNLSLLLVVLITAAALFAAPGVNKAGAAGSPANSAVQFLQDDYTANGINNSDSGVGSYALYVLNQAGVDTGTWLHEGVSLKDALISAISGDILNAAGPPKVSAKLLAQDLAAAEALGEDALAGQLAQILQDRESSAGFDGSPYIDIPAYDLLGRVGKLSVVDEVYAKGCILAAQNTTAADPNFGSFGSTWEADFFPDFMTTAQAVRALHYLDPGGSDSEIQDAIDAALNWMEAQQQDDGSFLGSSWDDPAIDTAEVVVALDALGMDPETWDSGGNTAVDYMLNDALNGDGSFGTSKNVMDATWALSAYNLIDVARSPQDSAVQFLQDDYTANGINNSDSGVGSYALYVLNQAGVDTGTWLHEGVSLKDALISAISGDILNAAGPPKVSAKLLAQDLAAAEALGEDGLAGQLAQILQDRESSAGFDGSPYIDIPAYDLLGRVGKLSVVDEVYAKGCILAAQNTTAADPNFGSFGSTWEADFFPDFMTTAQAVRALNYLDTAKSDAQIQTAINNGLNWIQKQQQADGSFKPSDWDDPVIDTSEAIVTLKALGMDPAGWKSGGGKTAVDYMMNNALNNDESFGTSKNDMDATWALCAYNLVDTMFYLDPSAMTLKIDGTEQSSAIWDNADGATDVTAEAQWSVADSSIASVDSSGLVTARKAGQTVVNAVYGGLTASAGVTVSASAPGGVVVSDGVDVELAVVGTDNKLLYGPSGVSVLKSNKWGLTALGALDASGIPYETSSWSYGYLVDSIDGLANSGMSGWMYTVNGSIPGVGADQYKINDGNRIIFYYSKNMDQQPPKWDDLVSGNIGIQPVNLPAPVSDTALDTAVQNAGTTGLVALQVDNTHNLLALSNDQLTKILNTGKPMAATIQGVQFILSPDSLKVPEIKAADTAQLQLTVQKVSSGDAQGLIEPFAVKFKLAGDIYELNVLVENENGTQISIEQFPDCKVLLPVPEALREAAAAGEVMAYRYNENSKVWEEVGGTYDATSGAISFKAEHFSKYALLETVSPPKEKITFKDITGHWAQKEIEYMAAKGYVAGVSENQFAPESKITRAEFAAILARMDGLADNDSMAERFNDVPAGAWYRGTVGAATTAGLVCGTSENSFAPDEPVTREQMAAMIVRFMSKNGVGMTAGDAGEAGSLAGFSDIADISPWASSPVALALRDGLMVGREEGRFVPLGSATRAEATVVLYRALQKEIAK